MAGFPNANLALALERSIQEQRGMPAGEGAEGGQNANLQLALAKSLQIESTRKVAAGELSADPPLPTYLYYGHGRDILVPNPDFPGQWMGDYNHEPVPADCIFVSFSAAGISTYESSILKFSSNIRTDGFINKLSNPVHFFEDLHRSHKESNKHLEGFISPEIFNNLKLLLRKPGEIYAETFFMPLATWPVKHTPDYELHASGIYDLRNKGAGIFNPESDKPLIMKDGNSTIELILSKFNGSIFPTPEDIIQELNKIYTEWGRPGLNVEGRHVSHDDLRLAIDRIKEKRGVRTQVDLFRLFPGIHYNSSCRAMDEGKNVSASLHVARKMSANRARLLFSPEHLWDENEKPKLSNFFRELSVIAPLNTILKKINNRTINEDFIQSKPVKDLFIRIDTFLKENNFSVNDILRLKQEDIKVSEFVNTPQKLKEAVDILYGYSKTFRGGKRKQTMKKKRSTKYKSKKRR
jgi:hypothetical protein